MLPEVQYAVRSLLQSRGFTAIAVLTLGFGIAASSILFSMLDAVILRPLPFKDPDRVVEIWARDSERAGRRVPSTIVDAIRTRSRTMEGIAIHGPEGGTLQSGDGPVRIFGRHVSPNYFEVLGVVIAAFATNAVLLTALGVFGLVAYSVSLRRSEFGIRTALGAHSRDLLIITIRSVLISATAGVIVGVATAMYLTRFIESQLYSMAPHPVVYVGAALVMLSVAVAAACVPAHRGALVDPIVALRYE